MTDWVDSMITMLRRQAPDAAARAEIDRDLPDIRRWLQEKGPPKWLGGKKLGERGKYFAECMTGDELRESRERAIKARDVVRESFPHLVDKTISPKESDLLCAVTGARYFKTCRSPESSEAFLSALELQALSISMNNREYFANLSGDDCAMSHAQSSACWVKNGCPMVVIDDPQWCASLAATTVHRDLAGVIAPPWSAFRVAIPSGILSIEVDGSERVENSVRMMVMRDLAGDWTLVLEGKSRMMHLAGESTAGLCDDVDVDRRNIVDEPGIALTGRDGRCLRLAARLVLAICMKMDNRHERPNPKIKHLSKAHRGAKDPIVRRYSLQRPIRINVDARPALRAYLEGSRKGAPPTTQALIRGHWKNQPHGIGATERKFIHIEPYWRGPEDAPIAVRPHILKGSPEAPTP